ncbi:MAG: Asp-tRNA(Asn)/Glu-tRNA(Gln) amidotransferase subunit GatB [Candidatus Margulisbacteria bacterium]|nr:Asp-tRNA(Asn)/Glu-tRNA(Gln) amidotransferase subunit GatB [Candidatus Margulisiibacteriota bacterium]
MKYEPVIGIEVHAQLKTNTKLFCRCATLTGQAPNSQVCPICLGMPGTLPVLNEKSVSLAIVAGLSLSAKIHHTSVFARKNYFYPDLPKGYQISQFDLPICTGGYLDITIEGNKKRVGITRIHMEEDAGKLIHQGADAIAGSLYSLVDLNRAGTPLVEIVSEPDIRSAQEARIYVENLKHILEFSGVCDGNMEAGNLRADANVSIRPVGETEFGTRTEVKNLNSFRSLERAINVEIKRQTQVLEEGGKVIQETRNYDDQSQKTTVLRKKEDAHDYRYFPDPDLRPLTISDERIQKLKEKLPELPQEKKKRYIDTYQVPEGDCNTLLSDVDMSAYFEACLEEDPSVAVEVSKWMVGDLNALAKENKVGYSQLKVVPKHLVEMIQLIESGNISKKMGKDILLKMFETGNGPKELIKESGGSQISDEDVLVTVVDKVLAENPDVVEKIKGGKTKSADFLMGQVMRETKGCAKPDLVRRLILKQIGV